MTKKQYDRYSALALVFFVGLSVYLYIQKEIMRETLMVCQSLLR